MDRPYHIEEDETVHVEHGDCDFEMHSDATATGVHMTLYEHGGSLCTECIPDQTRAALLAGAGRYGEQN